MMTRRGWYYTTATLALPLLAGCGGSSSSTTTTTNPASASTTLSDGLTATLTENQATVAVGGTVTYTASLTNSTSLAVSYSPVNSGGTSQAVPVSLFVENSSSQLTYPLGAATVPVVVGSTVTLAPGQSVSETIAVSTNTNNGLTVAQGYAAAGIYTANAAFSLVPGTTSTAAQISGTAGPVAVTAQ